MRGAVGFGPPGGELRRGIRAGLPLFVPLFALAVSFGVLAKPVVGSSASVAMSIVVFAGAAQFATVSVLAAGGGAAAAALAGLLMNVRFLPMGFAAARSLRGGRWARAAQGQAIVDASWALASRGDGSFDRAVLLGATVPQFLAWTSGTAVGVLAGSWLGDPERLGLDGIFPAFYLALLVGEVRDHTKARAALAGTSIALVLMPFAPAGIAVLAASLGALTGLARR